MPHDVIILGLGSMGSAAACELARRGVRVLGLEQFSIPHTQGSHGGFSRMIRLAYFEHPDYVALLRRSYERWAELEAESGQRLLHITGGIYLGRPDSELINGSLHAAREHRLPHESLTRHELTQRFPQFHLPDDMVGVYENQAGFLLPEVVVSTYAQLAMQHGAELHAHEPAIDWRADSRGVTVRTAEAEYHAEKLIITAGPWAPKLLRHLGVKMKVTRQTLAWYWPRKPQPFRLDDFPVWAIDDSRQGNPGAEYRGLLYGFPLMPTGIGVPGFKAALHFPGEAFDPDSPDRSPRDGDDASVRRMLEQYIPDAPGLLLGRRVCLYTNSPDGHFIVDRHPPFPSGNLGAERVTIACGFSGHGFKFVSVMGEVLADMATIGRTANPVEFLSLSRFRPRH